MQRHCLIWKVDIGGLDLQLPTGRPEPVMKFRSGAAAYGSDEVAAPLQILGC